VAVATWGATFVVPARRTHGPPVVRRHAPPRAAGRGSMRGPSRRRWNSVPPPH